jgi:hypothetical protein
MKRALIDPRNNSVAQLVEAGEEFPVAPPLYWDNEPETTEAEKSTKNTFISTIGNENLVVNTYIFGEGGGLAMHTHNDFGHTVEVLRGSVEVEEDGEPLKTLVAGQSGWLKANCNHEIRGLENPTIIVNVTSRT